MSGKGKLDVDRADHAFLILALNGNKSPHTLSGRFIS